MTETNQTTSAVYADDTPITVLFGSPARTKIISVMVGKRRRELNKSEIAEFAGVSRSTVYDHLDDLVALDVIEAVGEGTSRYRLADSDVADLLYQLDGVVLESLAERED